MKNVFLFLMVFLLATAAICPALGDEDYPLPDYAETDHLTWKFDADTGTLSIHGTGPMRSYYPDPPEWEVYKDQITAVRIDEGIYKSVKRSQKRSVFAQPIRACRQYAVKKKPNFATEIGCVMVLSFFDRCCIIY